MTTSPVPTPQTKSSDGTSVEFHDRVYEAYYGKMGGPEFMRDTQQRINWICQQVQGQSILDVGTSQGIVPILLAREGRQVIGIDLDAKAIDEAKNFLANEDASVQSHIQFVQTEFLRYELATKFDTVVLSEVLEHLLRPQDFVAKAATLLKSGGHLIVTVPFGINDFVDHKRTYYLQGILDLLQDKYTVEHIEFLGKWIGFRSRQTVSPKRLDVTAFLPGLESAFLERERWLVDQRTLFKTRADDAAKKKKDDATAISKLRDSIALAQTNEKVLQTQLADAQQANEISTKSHALVVSAFERELGQIRESAAADLARLSQAEMTCRAARDDGERRIARLETELVAVQKSLATATDELKASKQTHEHLRKQIASESTAKQLAQQNLGILTKNLEEQQQTQTQSLALYDARIATLHEELLQTERRHGLVQAELVAARAIIETDLRTHQESQARIADLERQLQELLAIQQVTEQVLAELRTEKQKQTESLRQTTVQLQIREQELAEQKALTVELRVEGQRQIELHRQSLAELQTREQELAEQKERTLAQITTLTTDLSAEKSQRAQIDLLVASLSSERSDLQTRLVDLEQNLTQIRTVASETTRQLQVCEQEREEQKERALAQITTLTTDLSTEKSQRAQIEVLVASLSSERSDLQTRLADLEQNLTQVRTAASETTKQLQSREQELTVTHDELRNHQAQARRDADAAKKRIAILDGRIATLVEIGTKEEQQRASAEQQCQVFQNEISVLSETLVTTRASTEQQCQVFQNEISVLSETLVTTRANSEQQFATLGKELTDLKTVLHQERALAVQTQNDLKRSLATLTKANLEAGSRLAKERTQREAAQKQVIKTKATLSFQLGHILLQAGKSWKSALALPVSLWRLRSEAARRRQTQELKLAPCQPTVVHRSAPTVPPPPIPSGPAKPLHSLRVAAIMDPFTATAFAPECELQHLHPDTWKSVVENARPDFLLIESAWQGKDDAWHRQVAQRSHAIVELLEWCRSQGIPSAFWNKEDPIHFETFLNTAKLFDCIFTTDLDCIPRYKRLLGHDRVQLLPFACQPRVHNPIETKPRKDAFCFAGAYYARYPDRTRDLEDFLLHLPDFKPVEIYDRNQGKNDPNYQFPAAFQPFIVGTLPTERIAEAYKGYRYAINLNSIKQSQSMFARRVFELLACNTLTVSNDSRGLRLFFGDVVQVGDSGTDLVHRLRSLTADPIVEAKTRLVGLRTVMREHTYQDRLAAIASCLQVPVILPSLPQIFVLAAAANQTQADYILAAFQRQTYDAKKLLLVTAPDLVIVNDPKIQVLSQTESNSKNLSDHIPAQSWLAAWSVEDYYGPNYLTDLALATRFTTAPIIGKHAYFSCPSLGSPSCTRPPGEDTGPTNGHPPSVSIPTLNNESTQYHPVPKIPVRAAIARSDALSSQTIADFLTKLSSAEYQNPNAFAINTNLSTTELQNHFALAIDPFNYCKNGINASFDPQYVDDLHVLNQGLSLTSIQHIANKNGADQIIPSGVPIVSANEIAQWFPTPARSDGIDITPLGDLLQIQAQLADGKHEYRYAAQMVDPVSWQINGDTLRLHLMASPGLHLHLTLLFLDSDQKRLGSINLVPNHDHTVTLPPGTINLRAGLRIQGTGTATIEGLILGHCNQLPITVMSPASILVVTNHYPSHGDLYRNAFVHRRVLAYRRQGLSVEVVRVRPEAPLSYHTHEGVDCISGSHAVLEQVLRSGKHRSILVHFLDERIWQVLQPYADRVQILVWVHGADIQSYERRAFCYSTPDEHQKAKTAATDRLRFWRTLLQNPPKNLKLIFVSRWLAETALADLGVTLRPDQYSVIPNPIDTDLFTYTPKDPEQRKRILSIRPFNSPVYANDLTVAAIQLLAKEPCFKELHFRIVGDGPLFEQTVKPLRQYANVTLDQRFLTQREIAALHKDYGIFLCPSRMDTQGVSRDEAMASGLVPVTTAVGAIPEFVDAADGVVVAPESPRELALAIIKLRSDPERYVCLSASASTRIAHSRNGVAICTAEYQLITSLLRNNP